ncbi:MAG: class B sortase [Oscillospiraceae bacterium]|nr:class B sortase [Oscillospiraceae bacterium]
MKKSKKLLLLLLALVLLLSAFTGCRARDGGPVEEEAEPASSVVEETSPPAVSDKKISDVIEDMTSEVKSRKDLNSDTVGWFMLHELGVSDVVVMSTESNEFYRRRNFNKEEEFNGVLYADRRSTFGNGSAEELGVNTCIYGHTLTNIRSSPDFNVFFGPLFDLRDQTIARDIPYMFFSTEKENLVFEIFAVFIANTDNADLPYNRNDIPADEFVEMVRTQVLPRSFYNYNVDIKDDDKFLTLSTCLYRMPDGTQLNYKTTYYRYAVMGKLVDPDQPLKLEADFTLNPNPLIDPDGPMASV